MTDTLSTVVSCVSYSIIQKRMENYNLMIESSSENEGQSDRNYTRKKLHLQIKHVPPSVSLVLIPIS